MAEGSLTSFYEASASVAGALIGLLFVAVSVAQSGEGRGNVYQNIRAGASMTAFSNALAVSLFTLIEGPTAGAPSLVVSVIGLCFVTASLISLRRRPRALREVLFLVTLVIALIAQFITAIEVMSGPTRGDERQAAVMVAVFFLIGIARAWELIDGPAVSVGTEMLSVARRMARPAESRSETEEASS